MEQSNQSIDTLFSQLKAGEIQIPAFQRGFVWTAEQVSLLYDSIYKGFPIGNLLFWETSSKLAYNRKIGQLEPFHNASDNTFKYVLDGQQRLTSLCGLFDNRIFKNEDNQEEWLDIYFDLDSNEDSSQPAFLPLSEEDVDYKKYFPVSKLMDSTEYRKATRELPDDQANKLDQVVRKLSSVMLSIEKFKTNNMKLVSSVFERINTAGTDLDHFQLLSAWTWSEDFVLQEKFSDLVQDLGEFGLDSENPKHLDLLLKCCTGIFLEQSSTDAILDLNGDVVREKFTYIDQSFKATIQFLKDELNIHKLVILPYASMLIPLVKFFYAETPMGSAYTKLQKEKILKWFWRTSFYRRYSNAIDAKIPDDIREMSLLKSDENTEVFNFKSNIDVKNFFIKNKFSPTNINTKTFICMLSSEDPKSFISGSKISVSAKIHTSVKTEYHHIHPRKHLERLGVKDGDINCLANFCFLTKADNLKIRDKAPEEYKLLITSGLNEVLEKAVCPADTLDTDYKTFLKNRNTLLIQKAESLYK